MSPSKLQHLGLTLLVGALIGRLIGNLFFGFSAAAVLLTLVTVLLYLRRHQQQVSQQEAQQLMLYRLQAEQAVRDGAVGSCPSCKRAMSSRAPRCLYCGTYRGDGPLR